MIKADIYDLEGKVVENITFDFDLVDYDEEFIRECWYALKKRHHIKTAHTKEKVHGTTKKAYKQKGTGNARRGAGKDPQFVGGRIIFGPLAIQRKISLNKSVVKRAKKMLLSELIRQNKFKLINDIKISDHKTKTTKNILDTFECKNSLCIHSNEIEQNNLISANNLNTFHYSNVSSVTIFDLLSHEKVLITKNAALSLVNSF